MTSAADTGGAKTQTSDFYQGIFEVKQAVPKKKPKKPAALITDLVMKGQIARSQCAPLKGARAAAAQAAKKKKGPKSVLGKLWGNGKGKFRTSGKYSSATVRGTIWLVEDRCDGTLTKVSAGRSQVRDFKRKKTVTVKAGHSYLARAQRAASKTQAARLKVGPALRSDRGAGIASRRGGGTDAPETDGRSLAGRRRGVPGAERRSAAARAQAVDGVHRRDAR